MAAINSRLTALESRAVRRRRPKLHAGLAMPDNIVEFALSPRFLGENLFPRQGTLLKLAASELHALTDYDRRVIAEWGAGFTPRIEGNQGAYVGHWGTTPDILERIAAIRALTGGGIEEFLAIIGRRGSKNYCGAILAARQLHRLCGVADFTEEFGVQRGKRLQIFVFAASKDQALRNQMRDIKNVVRNAPCFAGLVAAEAKDSLLLYTAAQRAERGDRLRPNDALIEVIAAETTERAARGPAMPMAMFDEFAHVTGAGSTADSTELYAAARPATRQFKGSGLVYQASSPWDRQGQLWISYQRGLELNPDTGTAKNPEIALVQLCSWDLYTDFADAESIEAWPGGLSYPAKSEAVIEFDDYMRRAEEANEESFATEHRSHFRTSGIAYLKAKHIDAMFAGWKGRPLEPQTEGILSTVYAAHADPARSGDRFGFACGHLEDDTFGVPHVIIDETSHWAPQDFPRREINYPYVDQQLEQRIRDFAIHMFTFDQYNSAGSIDRLRAFGEREGAPWVTRVEERTAAKEINWKMFETFKTALGHGLIHAPHDALLRAELEALEFDKGRVDHPHRGDVQTKDLVDCVVNVTWTLYGGDKSKEIFDRLCKTALRASQQAVLVTPKTVAPPPHATPQEQLSATGRSKVRRIRAASSSSPARGINRSGRR